MGSWSEYLLTGTDLFWTFIDSFELVYCQAAMMQFFSCLHTHGLKYSHAPPPICK